MRKFKISGRKFEIDDICDKCYKYQVLMFNEEKQYWVCIGKCNTLNNGKELAYDFIEKEKETERYNEEAKIKEQEYIKKVNNTKIYCSECGEELNLEDKINLEDICHKCILNYY